MGPGRAAADLATADRPAGREQENAGGSYETPYQKDQPQISPGRSALGALRLHHGDPGAQAFGHPRRNEGIDVAIEHRSEEHTSELQSLMRISYAVFCLKKTNINKHTYNINN